MITKTYDPDKRKLLSSLSHGSIFASALLISAGIPLAILFVSDDPVTKENAREALNLHFNVWLYGIIAGIIGFFWWTVILLPVIAIMTVFLLLMSWVMPVLAILSGLNDPEEPYRYPFIFRVL